MAYSIPSKSLRAGRGHPRQVTIEANCPECGAELVDPHGRYLGVVEGVCPEHGVVTAERSER